ncbi:plastocyanin/azurin family copper-binding protein [bacterium]|nr:plastocyanin/azurin family copper-binding protein [bacterium]MDC0319123.1 plastocyanin/azurin family copper-binding protein [Verrucomicrobiota bacterium]MDA7675385.1 plastocyanin/azurin family copper-binding protein [bacterium]MDB4668522.1 plastocyanin/azurin family copper-binding protein [bacterium]MDB4681247.1 plastocyanin/azurin family copper-binding protein [bacterium]
MKDFIAYLVVIFSVFAGAVVQAEEKKKSDSIKIIIESNDLMKFNKTSINAEKGKSYKITLKNVGTLPKAAMGHNLVILNPGTDALKFGTELITKHGATLQNEWKPVKAGKQVLAQTKMIGPSEEDTFKVKFDKSGVYHFLCTFPGHFAQMRGVINVK